MINKLQKNSLYGKFNGGRLEEYKKITWWTKFKNLIKLKKTNTPITYYDIKSKYPNDIPK
jgi:hypothetical protein